jgi:hypothetical protein
MTATAAPATAREILDAVGELAPAIARRPPRSRRPGGCPPTCSTT